MKLSHNPELMTVIGSSQIWMKSFPYWSPAAHENKRRPCRIQLVGGVVPPALAAVPSEAFGRVMAAL